jgi:hypothetical protein
MRSVLWLGAFAAAAALTACNDTRPPLSPTESITSNCGVSLTRLQSNPLVVAAHSSGLARWSLNNTGLQTVTATSQSQVHKGQVTSVTSQTDYPVTVPVGESRTIAVGFGTGSSGTGSVLVAVTNSCAGPLAGSYDVTVQ